MVLSHLSLAGHRWMKLFTPCLLVAPGARVVCEHFNMKLLPLLSAGCNNMCMEGIEKAEGIILGFLKLRIDVYTPELNYLYT